MAKWASQRKNTDVQLQPKQSPVVSVFEDYPSVSDLSFADHASSVDLFFADCTTVHLSSLLSCVFCPRKFNDSELRDEIARKEYSISRICQKCQDKVFAK